MREVMPQTAQIVDELRAAVGRELVDVAIRAGQQARRQAEQIASTDGQAEADAWLARQTFPTGCFWAEEAGRTVGVRRPR